MKRNELDQAFGPTPPIFSTRVSQTLRTLPEKPRTRKTFTRRLLVIALITVLLLGAAYALVVTQGQDWYYHNRFTAYQNHKPEKQQAILSHLTTDIPQQQTNTDLVTVTVQDVSWAPENGIATLSLAIRPKHPGTDELYSILNLDEDGSWSDTPDPENPDSRTEHWLWTDKGYGPPAKMMADPAKRLLLLDDGDSHYYIGNETDTYLPQSVGDQFQGDNGSVICVMEFDLNQLNADKIREESAAFVFDPSWGVEKEAWDQSQAESLASSLANAEKVNAAIAANTDANGLLTLRYEYSVVPFADNTLQTEDAVRGVTVFQIKITP